MPTFLSTLLGWAYAAQHGGEVRTLADVHEHLLRDIGLQRTDVHAALAPLHRDPSTILKALCCHWQMHRVGSAAEPIPCC